MDEHKKFNEIPNMFRQTKRQTEIIYQEEPKDMKLFKRVIESSNFLFV